MNGLAGTREKMRTYCLGKGYEGVTDECIKKANRSDSKEIRKLGTKAMSTKRLGKGD